MALTDDAIEGIKQMIVDGRRRPGDRLPPSGPRCTPRVPPRATSDRVPA